MLKIMLNLGYIFDNDFLRHELNTPKNFVNFLHI